MALRHCVFLWNAATGATQKLLELPQTDSAQANIVTSLAWGDQPGCNTLAIGTHSAEIQLWDVTAGRQVRRCHEEIP